MLEELAWTHQLPALAHLLVPDDVPRKEHRLPRPLTPEQDQLIQRELLRRNDFTSNALLLIRHTGMRIGECIDLSVDCLRAVGPDQWAIHVPLGKLKTERLVPVDSLVCKLVDRLRSMRSPDAPSTGRLLLSGPRGHYMLPRKLRNALRDVATATGVSARIVPHQMRHTYATEMLRAGVTLAAVMKLLGHKSPYMTLQYLEITQSDLQREYHLALAHPRHLVPSPPTSLTASPDNLDPAGILNSLRSAQHVLEMFRRTLPEGFSRRLLDRLINRLTKIIAEIARLDRLEK
jgi:integrase